MSAPLPYRWTGSEFLPLRPKLADKDFVIGEVYRLEAVEERSLASHNHYFAALHECWMSLSDDLAERFPTEERLRKYALIKCGYADHRQIVASSKAEAHRLAGFIRPMDEYAVIAVSESVVSVYTAQSQSMKAMGKKAFNDSKQKVLDYIAGLIGVTPDELGKRGEAG
jgi:hypothetical protein